MSSCPLEGYARYTPSVPVMARILSVYWARPLWDAGVAAALAAIPVQCAHVIIDEDFAQLAPVRDPSQSPPLDPFSTNKCLTPWLPHGVKCSASSHPPTPLSDMCRRSYLGDGMLSAVRALLSASATRPAGCTDVQLYATSANLAPIRSHTLRAIGGLGGLFNMFEERGFVFDPIVIAY